jgi:hypothetical protein
LYCLIRLFRRPVSISLVLSWVAGQVGALALLLLLYRVQISHLHGSEMAQRAAQTWMRTSYFQAGHDNPFLFSFARTFGVFQFVFGQNAIGVIGGLLFCGGLVLLFRRKTPESGVDSRLLAAFLLAPFVLNCIAALTGAYPYGGTRHSAILAMFALAGTSVCLAHWTGQRVVRGMGIALVVVAACHLIGAPHRPYMMRADQSARNMARAVDAIRSRVPVNAPVFADYQTSFLLRQYLCPEPLVLETTSAPEVRTFSCAGHQVLTTREQVWIESAAEFIRDRGEIVQMSGLKPGESLWVFQAGWDIHLAEELERDYPGVRPLQAESFGRNVSLFALPVSQLAPVSGIDSQSGKQ